jgi:NitT/TauT family transport system substrate-binding protein
MVVRAFGWQVDQTLFLFTVIIVRYSDNLKMVLQRRRRLTEEQVMTGEKVAVVSIGAGAAGFNFLPVFLAQRLGLFARRGLEVTVKRTGSTDKATAALATGELDIAMTPPEGALASFAAGGPLRIVGGNLNTLPLNLIANPRFKRIEDLRGASLGTSSLTEGTALYTMEILAQHGLHYPGDYSFSMVGVHTARWEALKKGTLDAALQLLPLNFVGIEEGYSNLGSAQTYLPDIAFISIIVDDTWASANRDVLVSMLAAIKEGTEYLYDKANDAISIAVAAEETKTDAKYVRLSLDLIRDHAMMPKDLSIPAAALATSIRLMRQAKLLDVQTVRDPSGVIDDSYRLQALRRYDQ